MRERLPLASFLSILTTLSLAAGAFATTGPELAQSGEQPQSGTTEPAQEAPTEDETAEEGPASLSGELVVTSDERTPLFLTRNADGTLSETGGDPIPALVAIEGAAGELIALEGSQVEDAETGDFFEGVIDRPEPDVARVISGEVFSSPQVSLLSEGPDTAAASAVHQANVVWFGKSGISMPSEAAIRGAVTDQAGKYWKEQSGGIVASIGVSGTVYRQNVSFDICNPQETWTRAAALFGRTTSYYWSGNTARHLIVVVPGSVCGGAGNGLGSVGDSLSSGGLVWATVNQADPSTWTGVLAHELGHNFSLMHANQLGCSDLDDGPNSATFFGDFACTVKEYYDSYTVMGMGYTITSGSTSVTNARVPGPLTPVNRKDLGILGGSAGTRVVTVAAGTTQTQTLRATGQTSGVRSLTIIDPKTDEELFVEYRSNIDLDAGTLYADYAATWPVNPTFSPGVRIVRPFQDTSAGKQSNVTSQQATYPIRQWFGTGQTFRSYTTAPNGVPGVSVQVISETPTEATVRVTFNTVRPPFSKVAAPKLAGSATTGSTLSISGGAAANWTPTATKVSYQWLRAGKPITGATGATYKLVPADVGQKISARLTASRDGYTNSTVTTPSASITPAVKRLSGANRYDTSIAVTKTFGNTGGTVYVATGQNFPDALSVGPVAAKAQGSLLLTGSTSASTATLSELKRLAPTKVILVGGTGAISTTVKNQMQRAVPKATFSRISGKNRYETSLNLLEKSFAKGQLKSVYFATGATYADALVAGPVATSNSGAILVIPGMRTGTELNRAISTAKKLGATEAFVLGGKGAVSEQSFAAVKKAFPKTERLGAKNRYETAVVINRKLPKTTTQVWLASGADFPDALSASVPAGTNRSPIYLSRPTCTTQPVAQAVKSRLYGTRFIAGGTGALSGAAANLTVCR